MRLPALFRRWFCQHETFVNPLIVGLGPATYKTCTSCGKTRRMRSYEYALVNRATRVVGSLRESAADIARRAKLARERD